MSALLSSDFFSCRLDDHYYGHRLLCKRPRPGGWSKKYESPEKRGVRPQSQHRPQLRRRHVS